MPTPTRYHSLAIILHWVMAACIFWMLFSGVMMEYILEDKKAVFQWYQWHKASGVLVLLALALRIIIRLFTRQPALPDEFPAHEKRLAKLGHLGLYALMTTMPMAGWVMVSASPYGLPTIVFDWFTWPHIPDLQGNKDIEEIAETIHFYGAIALGIFLAAHLGAVVKHNVKDNINLLPRMWWGK